MLGTFGGALEARQIDASNGKLTADVTGEVEQEDGVLVIRRIHVAMRLDAPGRREEDDRTGTWHIRDELPSLSHVAQGDPPHIHGRVLLKPVRQPPQPTASADGS
jgi:hypothetical protein